MLKPLTFSLGLAIALGACSVSMAGLFGGGSGCSTCGIASPQSIMPSAQCAPSPQCDTGCNTGGGLCGGGKKLFSCFNKPKCYSYEWVLKKKRVWGCHKNTCNTGGCDTGCSSPIYPSSQSYPSPQVYGSGQAYGTGQSYSAPQAYGTGQAYAAGQAYGAPQATGAITTAPAAPVATDEAPPAPDAPAPATPAPSPAPAPAPANAPQSSLLFSTPSGN